MFLASKSESLQSPAGSDRSPGPSGGEELPDGEDIVVYAVISPGKISLDFINNPFSYSIKRPDQALLLKVM